MVDPDHCRSLVLQCAVCMFGARRVALTAPMNVLRILISLSCNFVDPVHCNSGLDRVTFFRQWDHNKPDT